MLFQAAGGHEWAGMGRLWRFAQFEFDESSRVLRRGGDAIDLESKPIEVLLQLLLRAGEVVSKEELLESAWPGVTVVEGSLATAVSKLRKALGDDEQTVIVTVPRVGYRLGVPAQCSRVAAPASPELGFEAGQTPPGREDWRFARKLDESASSEVWLAQQEGSGELRVFKFAGDGVRLRGLKREVTLARLLREALGERADFVRVFAWNFEAAPFWLESEFGGADLAQWAEDSDGLGAIAWERRLAVFLDAARAVAAAHRVGILHKDLKPRNILVSAGGQVKVADFGSGALAAPERLSDFGITNLGFTQTEQSGGSALTGTLMYLPPEVLAGNPPTALGDVYALGVLLYQMAAGDFRKPLSPGWENDVEDALLREDIAEAARGDSAKRVGSVEVLIERLENLRAAKDGARRTGGGAGAGGVGGTALGGMARAAAVGDRGRGGAGLGVGGQFVAVSQRRPGAGSGESGDGDCRGGGAVFGERSDRTDRSVSKWAQRGDSGGGGEAGGADIDRQFHDAPEVAARLIRRSRGRWTIAAITPTRGRSMSGRRRCFARRAGSYRRTRS